MTGSSRVISTSSLSMRTPYSAPQPLAAPIPSQFGERSAVRPLPPFVPRDLRTAVQGTGAMWPEAQQSSLNRRALLDPVLPAKPLTFDKEPTPLSDFDAFLASHEHSASDETSSQDLPWIDAFAVDAVRMTDGGSTNDSSTEGALADIIASAAGRFDEVSEANSVVPDAVEYDDAWPLGEAGKRLDELTQSLSSIDELRARQAETSSEQPADVLPAAVMPPDASHPMWNDEEWIDIMPTSAMVPEPEAVSTVAPSLEGSSAQVGAEAAALALEGLAQRVRTGNVKVPTFSAELGQEAMLAGLLASMLGWHL